MGVATAPETSLVEVTVVMNHGVGGGGCWLRAEVTRGQSRRRPGRGSSVTRSGGRWRGSRTRGRCTGVRRSHGSRWSPWASESDLAGRRSSCTRARPRLRLGHWQCTGGSVPASRSTVQCAHDALEDGVGGGWRCRGCDVARVVHRRERALRFRLGAQLVARRGVLSRASVRVASPRAARQDGRTNGAGSWRCRGRGKGRGVGALGAWVRCDVKWDVDGDAHWQHFDRNGRRWPAGPGSRLLGRAVGPHRGQSCCGGIVASRTLLHAAGGANGEVGDDVEASEAGGGGVHDGEQRPGKKKELQMCRQLVAGVSLGTDGLDLATGEGHARCR
jgi:hypothetical protein